MSHENHWGYYVRFIRQTRKVLCTGTQLSALCGIMMMHLFHVGWIVDKIGQLDAG